MVTDYRILQGRWRWTALPEYTIESKVNNAIKDGWTPLGGVFLMERHQDPDFSEYGQAMIKESKE